MPKPRRTIRPTYLNLALPEDIRAKLDLHLFSDLEGRVPHGAYSRFICHLLRRELGKPLGKLELDFEQALALGQVEAVDLLEWVRELGIEEH